MRVNDAVTSIFGAEGVRRLRRALLAALALCLPVSIAASNAVWLTLLGVCLLEIVFRPSRRRYRWTGLELFWLVYFVVSLVASCLSVDPRWSLSKLHSEVLILIFVLAAQCQTPAEARTHVRLLAGSAAVAALWGLAQYGCGIRWDSARGVLTVPDALAGLPDVLTGALASWNGRATGFFNHPLTYAEVLLLVWPLLLAEGFGVVGQKRVWAWSGALAVLAALGASGSRGVWLSLIGLLALWAVFRRQRRVAAALGGVLLLGVLLMAVSPMARSRFTSMFRPRADSSNAVRLSLWEVSWQKWQANPVWGVGIGHVHISPKELRWPGPRTDMDWTEVHNIFLQMGVERGFLGLAAYLLFLLVMGKLFWRAETEGRIPGVFWGFLGLVMAGMTESWTHDSEVVMVLYFLLGCACAGGTHPSAAGRRLSRD